MAAVASQEPATFTSELPVKTVPQVTAEEETEVPANLPYVERGVDTITGGFPADGLPKIVRHITGHNAQGKSVFLLKDTGDHQRVMGKQQAVANIMYSTDATPVDLNGDHDMRYAAENEPPLHIHNGSVARMIDFGPNVESPLHRAVSLDYGVVVEGMFKLILDSGEERIMRQGDVVVNRATAHKWHNISGNGTLPGRMLWILLDCKDVVVNGQVLEGYLGELAPFYAGQDVAAAADAQAA